MTANGTGAGARGNVLDAIRTSRVLADCSEATLEVLANNGRPISFPPDRTILRTDDAADRFYLIGSGRAAVEITTAGQQPIVLETVGRGELLGVSWLLAPYRWAFDGRAIEPITAIEFDADAIRSHCDRDPAVGYDLYRHLTAVIHHRLSAARLQMLDLYRTPGPAAIGDRDVGTGTEPGG